MRMTQVTPRDTVPAMTRLRAPQMSWCLALLLLVSPALLFADTASGDRVASRLHSPSAEGSPAPAPHLTAHPDPGLGRLGTVPTPSIPVSATALGDLDTNLEVSLRDLLRLRDIVREFPPPADPNETERADLDGNGIGAEVADLAFLAECLLRARPVPSVIGSDGGTVIGNEGRTIFYVPSGVLSATTRVSVSDFRQAALEDTLGGPLSQIAPTITFLAGAVLAAEHVLPQDSLWTSEVSMFEAVPPGTPFDSTGTAFAFGMSPDRNADGRPDLVLRGPLSAVVDTTALMSEDGFLLEVVRRASARPGGSTLLGMALPGIAPIDLASVVRVHLELPGPIVVEDPGVPLYPGDLAAFAGGGWPSDALGDYDVVWAWAGGSDTTSALAIDPVGRDPGVGEGLVTAIPLLPEGSYQVHVVDRRIDLASNDVTVPVRALDSSVMTDVRQRAIDHLSANIAGLQATAAESVMAAIFPDRVLLLTSRIADLEALQERLETAPDDSVDLSGLSMAVRYADNLSASIRSERNGVVIDGGARTPCVNPDVCARLCRERFPDPDSHEGRCRMECHFRAALCWNNPMCGFDIATCMRDCATYRGWNEDAERACRATCCYRVNGGMEVLIRSGTDPANDKGVWVCAHMCCPPLTGTSIGPTPGSPPDVRSSRGAQAGLLVSVAGSPTPLSVGHTNGTGTFMIPVNVLSGHVTLSTYDPRTGLFDAAAGECDVSSPFEDKRFVRLYHAPDSSAVIHVLSVGGVVADSVVSGRARHVFVVPVTSEWHGRELNMALRAFGELTVWIEDPLGQFVLRDSLLACAAVWEHTVGAVGSYRISVGYGALGEGGGFAFGVSEAPKHAIPNLCGDMRDTLEAGTFPEYIVDSSARVPNEESLAVEAGVRLRFVARGQIRVDGILHGSATIGAPIVLTGTSSSPALSPSEGLRLVKARSRR